LSGATAAGTFSGVAAPFDPFETLGVAPGATHEQIRAAYREQVARYHPDKHRGNPLEDLARAKLVEINRAYDILSDDAKRAAYDAKRRPAPSAGMKLVRSLGLLVAVVFLLRFGIALGRQVLLVVRGIVLGLLWVLRASPVLAVAVVVALALFAGLLVRSRKGSG
jgi:preprotein translocase subunit Sec63